MVKREHQYRLTVTWTGDQGSGTSGYRDFDRAHDVAAVGKPNLLGSADPAFRGTTDRWNPEELLVAALTQCHMLAYLSWCSRSGVVVTSYVDESLGTLVEERGVGEFAEVCLRPQVTVADESMLAKARALHENAHADCFIARSVNFPVRHEAEVSAG